MKERSADIDDAFELRSRTFLQQVSNGTQQFTGNVSLFT
jgi:hypothetical protein